MEADHEWGISEDAPQGEGGSQERSTVCRRRRNMHWWLVPRGKETELSSFCGTVKWPLKAVDRKLQQTRADERIAAEAALLWCSLASS